MHLRHPFCEHTVLVWFKAYWGGGRPGRILLRIAQQSLKHAFGKPAREAQPTLKSSLSSFSCKLLETQLLRW